jgi:hypothetical protein
MANQDFNIKRGRVYDILVTVSGIGSWTDLIMKMYIRKKWSSSTPDLTLTGSVNESTSVITFPITAAQSAGLDVETYKQEVVIYKADKTVVYDPIDGNVNVNDAIVVDPTA